MLSKDQILQLRQSTPPEALYNALKRDDPQFSAAVDRVRSMNPNMDALSEYRFPQEMVNLYYGLEDAMPKNERNTSLAREAMNAARQKSAGQQLVEDPLAFGVQTLKNVPKSAGQFFGGIAQAAVHPVQTGKALFQTAVGGAANTLETIANLAGIKNAEDIFDLSSEETASAIGDMFVERYGSLEAAANTLREDPVGFLSDASLLATGIGGAVGGIAGIAKTGVRAATAGQSAVSLASRAAKIGKAATQVGKFGGALTRRAIQFEPLVFSGRGVILAGGAARKVVGLGANAERLLKSSLSLHPNQIANFQKISGGEDAATYMFRKGILAGGETAVDLEKGVQMTGRTLFGRTIEGIQSDLWKVHNTAKDTVKKILAGVEETFDLSDVPFLEGTIEKIYGDIAKFPTFADDAKFLIDLQKKGRVSLTELNTVKQMMDKYERMYASSGGELSGLQAANLRNLRKPIQDFIETVADEKGLPDVRILNKDTQLSYELSKSIERAQMTKHGRAVISLADTMFGLGGYAVTNDLLTTAGIVIGRRILENPVFKTTIAKYFAKLSISERKAIETALKGGRKSKEAISALRRTVQQAAEEMKNKKVAEAEYNPIAESRLIGLKGGKKGTAGIDYPEAPLGKPDIDTIQHTYKALLERGDDIVRNESKNPAFAGMQRKLARNLEAERVKARELGYELDMQGNASPIKNPPFESAPKGAAQGGDNLTNTKFVIRDDKKIGEYELLQDYYGNGDAHIMFFGVEDTGKGVSQTVLDDMVNNLPDGTKTISAEPTSKVSLKALTKKFGEPIEISTDIKKIDSLDEALDYLPDTPQFIEGELDSSKRVFVRFNKPRKLSTTNKNSNSTV